MEFYSAYHLPPRVQLDFTADPGLTITTDKTKCDIHNILEFHTNTGLWNHVNSKPGDYGFHDGLDYVNSLEKLKETQQAFELLPSRIRNRFDNDPAKLLDFMLNPNNQKEGEEIGLYDPYEKTNGESQMRQPSQSASSGESIEERDGSAKS